MRYLLDTNVVSDLVRRPQGSVTARIEQVGEENVCTSIIVAAELRYGAAKKGSPQLAAQLEAMLSALDILPFEAPADAVHGELRARLEREGQPIGGNDLLIAAQALALGLTIVTDNEREFARIQERRSRSARWQTGNAVAQSDEIARIRGVDDLSLALTR